MARSRAAIVAAMALTIAAIVYNRAWIAEEVRWRLSDRARVEGVYTGFTDAHPRFAPRWALRFRFAVPGRGETLADAKMFPSAAESFKPGDPAVVEYRVDEPRDIRIVDRLK